MLPGGGYPAGQHPFNPEGRSGLDGGAGGEDRGARNQAE